MSEAPWDSVRTSTYLRDARLSMKIFDLRLMPHEGVVQATQGLCRKIPCPDLLFPLRQALATVVVAETFD